MTLGIINILAFLTLLADIFLVLVALYFIARHWWKLETLKKISGLFQKYSIALAFIIALTATLGSLFFSEIASLTPCKLCWFQRIFMYPQALILALAIYFKDWGIKNI